MRTLLLSTCIALLSLAATGQCEQEVILATDNVCASTFVTAVVSECPDAVAYEYIWYINDNTGVVNLIESGSVDASEDIPDLDLTAYPELINASVCLEVNPLDGTGNSLGQGWQCINVETALLELSDAITATCGGTCLTATSDSIVWNYSWEINSEVWQNWWQPYCFEELGTYTITALSWNGCEYEFLHEVTTLNPDDNDTCEEAIELVSGELIEDDICSVDPVETGCDWTDENFRQNWYRINSGEFTSLSFGVGQLSFSTFYFYSAEIWKETVDGDCTSLEIVECLGGNEISSCYQVTDYESLDPNTNYYLRILSYTGQVFDIAAVLSNDGSSACGCPDESNCEYSEDYLIETWCGYEGCTDPGACNYASWVTCDDGSCYFGDDLNLQVFHDLNGDGIWQEFGFSESALGNIGSVTIEELGIELFPDGNGQVVLPDLTPDVYTLTFNDPSGVWIQDEPLVLTLPSCTGADVAVIPANETLLQVSGPCCIWSMDIHCDFGFNPGLWLENTGSVPLNGTFTMTFDPILIPEELTGATPWDEYADGVMTWNIEDHLPGVSTLYQIHIQGPGPDLVGNVYPFDMQLEMVDENGDVWFTDNWVLEPIVTCAYDPNDKYAVPEGYTEENHFILADDEIEYRIRFQNTGNIPATDVIIEDQIDISRLDMDSFYPVFASHDFSTIAEPDGHVSFVFNNIMLPDSISDEPGSQGYVVYRIKPLPAIEAGEEINNFAEIYFDMNPAIVTNTTWHTIFDCEWLNLDDLMLATCVGETWDLDMDQEYVESYSWTVNGLEAGEPNEELEITWGEIGMQEVGMFVSNPLCSAENEIFVDVQAFPAEGIEVDGDQLTAVGEGETYIWFYNDVIIDGADTATITATETGLYAVEVITSGGCIAYTDLDFVVGISELESKLLIYPNPATSILNLFLPEGLWNVELIGGLGQIVKADAQVQGTLDLDVNDFARGVYSIKLSNEAGLQLVRQVVLR